MAESGTTWELRPIEAPSSQLLLLESRFVLELASLGLSQVWLAARHRGDGHPVLVLPGFGAGDAEMAALRIQLRGWGYSAHGWRSGRNLGPTPTVRDALYTRLDEIFARDGRRVSIVGWSLGGIYARHLARTFPEKVRSIVTLASPYRLGAEDRCALTYFVNRLAASSDGPHRDDWAAIRSDEEEAPLEVPSTSVYSRSDGIVRWHACIDRAGPQAENVEVHGSHCGLGFNAAAVYVVGDRLAQPEGRWRPFRAPRLLRHLYPEPVYWDPARRVSNSVRFTRDRGESEFIERKAL